MLLMLLHRLHDCLLPANPASGLSLICVKRCLLLLVTVLTWPPLLLLLLRPRCFRTTTSQGTLLWQPRELLQLQAAGCLERRPRRWMQWTWGALQLEPS